MGRVFGIIIKKSMLHTPLFERLNNGKDIIKNILFSMSVNFETYNHVKIQLNMSH